MAEEKRNETEENKKNVDDQKIEYGYCNSEDLIVVDYQCQACCYRNDEDPSVCKKYPQLKPMKIMDPTYYCPEFSVVDLDSL